MTSKESLIEQRFDGEFDDSELMEQLRMTFYGTGKRCEQVLEHIRNNDLEQNHESVNGLIDDVEGNTEKAVNVTDDNKDLIDLMDDMISLVEDGDNQQIVSMLDDIVLPLAYEIRDDIEELRPEMPPSPSEDMEILGTAFDNLVDEFTVVIALAEKARDRFQE